MSNVPERILEPGNASNGVVWSKVMGNDHPTWTKHLWWHIVKNSDYRNPIYKCLMCGTIWYYDEGNAKEPKGCKLT